MLDNDDLSAKDRDIIEQNIRKTYDPDSSEFKHFDEWFKNDRLGRRFSTKN